MDYQSAFEAAADQSTIIAACKQKIETGQCSKEDALMEACLLLFKNIENSKLLIKELEESERFAEDILMLSSSFKAEMREAGYTKKAYNDARL